MDFNDNEMFLGNIFEKKTKSPSGIMKKNSTVCLCINTIIGMNFINV